MSGHRRHLLLSSVSRDPYSPVQSIQRFCLAQRPDQEREGSPPPAQGRVWGTLAAVRGRYALFSTRSVRATQNRNAGDGGEGASKSSFGALWGEHTCGPPLATPGQQDDGRGPGEGCAPLPAAEGRTGMLRAARWGAGFPPAASRRAAARNIFGIFFRRFSRCPALAARTSLRVAAGAPGAGGRRWRACGQRAVHAQQPGGGRGGSATAAPFANAT